MSEEESFTIFSRLLKHEPKVWSAEQFLWKLVRFFARNTKGFIYLESEVQARVNLPQQSLVFTSNLGSLLPSHMCQIRQFICTSFSVLSCLQSH